jgi:hypothetical protein
MAVLALAAVACSSGQSGADGGGEGSGLEALEAGPGQEAEATPQDVLEEKDTRDAWYPDFGPEWEVTYWEHSQDQDVTASCEGACGVGEVKGRVCAPNTHTYVNNALIWVDATGCDGQPVHVEAHSDTAGNYTLKEVPCGTWQVNIQKGSFEHHVQAEVVPGQVTDISMQGVKSCFGGTAARLCVVTGDWDDIEGLLTDLGFQPKVYELYTGFDSQEYSGGEAEDLLNDLGDMQGSCDVLLFDCGAAHCDMLHDNPGMVTNLQQFVAAGGSLYASDFAYCYEEMPWPGAMDMWGDDDDCFWPQHTSNGPFQMDGYTKIDATILDPGIIGALGKNTFEANFGLGPLASVHAAGLALAHIEGMVKKFNEVQPFVLSYRPYPTGGNVIYTNFHNDEQTSADMQAILNYLIFEL